MAEAKIRHLMARVDDPEKVIITQQIDIHEPVIIEGKKPLVNKSTFRRTEMQVLDFASLDDAERGLLRMLEFVQCEQGKRAARRRMEQV